MLFVKKILTATVTASALILGTGLPALATAPQSASAKPHEGKRCKKKGKVVVVGGKYDKVKLKCKVTRRGNKKVKVWRYAGRA